MKLTAQQIADIKNDKIKTVLMTVPPTLRISDRDVVEGVFSQRNNCLVIFPKNMFDVWKSEGLFGGKGFLNLLFHVMHWLSGAARLENDCYQYSKISERLKPRVDSVLESDIKTADEFGRTTLPNELLEDLLPAMIGHPWQHRALQRNMPHNYLELYNCLSGSGWVIGLSEQLKPNDRTGCITI